MHSTLMLRSWLVILPFMIISWLWTNGAFAQIETPSSISPVGSGARALGMGGAFIAVADDATAASWNPGGLIQLETSEVSVVGAYFQRTEDNTFGTNPEASGLQDVDNGNLNYISAAYPFQWLNRNMIVSVNYQHLYDFTRNWDFQGTFDSLDMDVSIEEEGSLSAIGLASCIQMTPKLSLGLTINFWEDGLYDNKWKIVSAWENSGVDPNGAYILNSKYIERYSFTGLNANLGLLWSVNRNLTLGVVLKTPFTADIAYERDSSYELRYPSNPGSEANESSSSTEDENRELDMPLSYGIGVAYRFSDLLTVSADIYRTEWDDFVLTDEDGNKTSPITNKPINETHIDPTHQVRVGAEYLVISKGYVIPLRCGAFYDPKPAEGSPDDYYGLSFGSGIARGRAVFDVAYQYRFGNDVGKYILEDYDFSQDIREHTIYASVIFHF